MPSLRHTGYIPLPEHIKTPGGFDHADIHIQKGLLYVAHTTNSTVDVIDCTQDRYLSSIPNLKGVAGVLAVEKQNLIFTSNRGENTVGIFSPGPETDLFKVEVGHRPNGLAYDPGRNLLLVANVGDPEVPGSHTISMVDITSHKMFASIPVAGRTRWAMYDETTDSFYVNISNPPQIVVIKPDSPAQLAKVIDVSAEGPHGLGIDVEQGRLYCACDQQVLVTLDIHTGEVLNQIQLSGGPDVVFYNVALHRLYVVCGKPGVIDVIDTVKMELAETVETGTGAHTIAFHAVKNKVYAFLPETHRAMVMEEK